MIKKPLVILLPLTITLTLLNSCGSSAMNLGASQQQPQVKAAVKGKSKELGESKLKRVKKVVFSGFGIQNDGEKSFLGGMLQW